MITKAGVFLIGRIQLKVNSDILAWHLKPEVSFSLWGEVIIYENLKNNQIQNPKDSLLIPFVPKDESFSFQTLYPKLESLKMCNRVIEIYHGAQMNHAAQVIKKSKKKT